MIASRRERRPELQLVQGHSAELAHWGVCSDADADAQGARQDEAVATVQVAASNDLRAG